MNDEIKRSSDFAETSLIISEKNKNLQYFRKFAKTIFIRKKIQLQLSKSGVFREKKCSANSLKLRSDIVYSKHIHYILAKNFKKNLKWKKIQLQVSKSGVFGEKNVAQIP